MTLTRSGPRATQRWALLGAIVFALTLVAAMATLAINNTGAFELDGNATSASGSGGAAPDDWDRVCHEVTITNDTLNEIADECTSADDTHGATAVSWLAEMDTSATIFTGGGSKDPQDPQDSWLWKNDGGLPDKDNLLHGFAARYSLAPDATTCPVTGTATTCEVIFFGSDRFANDGDAVQGFWFFQNKIERTQTASQGGFTFSGHHRNGDLLIISDFSNGGSVSTIVVHKWDNTCSKAANNNPQPGDCSAANLRMLASSTAANCATAPATSGFCGIVNPADGTASPWSYTDKKGNNTFLNGEFFEGGVNLSALGLGSECFASVASETRSSTSPTATLKDFVLDSFGECETSLVTTPKTGAATPGALTADSDADNLQEINIGTDGKAVVKDSAVLTVNGVPSFTGTLAFALCGPISTPAACVSPDGTAAGSATVTTNGTYFSDAMTVTSVGRYCWRATFTSGTNGVPDASDSRIESASSTGECFEVLPVQPTISTSATETVVLGGALDDTATLLGTANQPGTPVIGTTAGPAAGGTITFKLYGPAASPTCTDPATGVPGNLVGTSVVPVDGDSGTGDPAKVYKASDATVTGTFSPTAVGTYYWIATYSGNPPNTLGVAGTCGDTGETSTVTGAASLATAQRWLPNDTAHVTSPAGTALSGTVTFTLYNDGTCGEHALVPAGGTSQYSVSRNVVTDADASPAPTANDRYVSTTNTGASAFVVTAANDTGAWSWWVTYDDAALNDPAPRCESTSAFTITD